MKLLTNKLSRNAPKSEREIIITKYNIATYIVIFIALFACYKIYNITNYKLENISLKTSLVLASIKDIKEIDTLGKYLTQKPFCGWKIEKNGQPHSISPNFKSNIDYNNSVSRGLSLNEINYVITVCSTSEATSSNSAYRQFALIFILTLIIYVLLNTNILKPTNEDPLKNIAKDE